MLIEAILVLTDNYIYFLTDKESLVSAVIDPAEVGPVLDALKRKNTKLAWVINTYHHWDHVGGNEELVRATGCGVACSKRDFSRVPAATQGLDPNSKFRVGRFEMQVIEVPGHTHGHMALYFPETGDLFTGDTLFGAGCGRLFEGNAGELFESLARIKKLPLETKLWFGHEYTKKNLEFSLMEKPNDSTLMERQHVLGTVNVPVTLADEIKTNLFLRVESVSELAELRKRRDSF